MVNNSDHTENQDISPAPEVSPLLTVHAPVNLVGRYIRERRTSLKLSQKKLGSLLTPQVTTQFISNIERGVTPLPVSHVAQLSKILRVSEPELMALMEKEYTLKLSQKLGQDPSRYQAQLAILAQDFMLFQSIYQAYQGADPRTREAFKTVCISILKLADGSSRSSDT